MKTFESVNENRNNFTESKSFKMSASAKSFKILSDKIYSDKILAVVRELSCNAYDSHVAAKKADVSFDVHFPTDDEKFFSVQDYGVGMSEEKLYDTYIHYFSSDKSDCNEYTGTLGLGSKSPFAYTNSFTVESIHNKKKLVFFCFLDTDGCPKITKVSEDISKEQNGFKVIVDVKSRDVSDFISKSYIFRYFKTKPNFNIKIDIKNHDVFIETELGVLLKKDRPYDEKLIAVQGNVAYQINKGLVKINDFFNNNSAVIYFNIGELDVAPSREELSYDNTTINNISSKLKSFQTQIEVKAQNTINEKETLFEAKTFLHELRRRKILVEFFYKGVNLHHKESEKFLIQPGTLKEKAKKIVLGYRKRKSMYFTPDYPFTIDIHYSSNNIFIVKDEKKATAKVAAFVRENSNTDNVFFIFGKDEKQVLEMLGNPKVKRSSEMTDVAVVPRRAPVKHEQYYNVKKQSFVNAADVTENSFFAKCSISKFSSSTKNKMSHLAFETQRWIDYYAKIITFPEKNFYIVSANEQLTNRFKEKNFISLDSFVKDNIAKLIEDNAFKKYLIDQLAVTAFVSILSNDEHKILLDAEINEKIKSKDSVFKKCAEFVVSIVRNDRFEKLADIARTHGLAIPEIKIEEENVFSKTYPLLKYIRFNYLSDKTEVSDYINLVDRCTNTI